VTISVGAALLGVPLWQAVAVVTFVGGFIPYFGAFLAGRLAVVLALTSGGLSTALLMLGVVLVVQNLLEPLLEAKVLGHT
jgi:putative heme transporter